MAPMLQEYFSIQIDANGNLLTLPQVVDNYVPPIEELPLFCLRLITEVDWEQEADCLNGICMEIGRFYSLLPLSKDHEAAFEAEDPYDHHSRAWKIQHVLFPIFRTELTPLKKFANDGSIMQIACLEKLYRVFERC